MYGLVVFVVFAATGISFVRRRFVRQELRSFNQEPLPKPTGQNLPEEKSNIVGQKLGQYPWGIIAFIGLSGLWLGLIFFSTLSFWLTLVIRTIGGDRLFYLAPEKISVNLSLSLAALYLLILLRQKHKTSITATKQAVAQVDNSKTSPFESSLLSSLASAPYVHLLILTILAAAFTAWLLLISFREVDGYLQASASVFSDLAPHTALTSAFAKGANIPTDYPHFAADGIRYHFFFYHLAGILTAGGLPIDRALNFLTWLGMVSFMLSLGLLAWRLTSRRGTILLAPLLALFRSSPAFFNFLSKIINESTGDGTFIWQALLKQQNYIGNTPREEWGLWSINVYANQRHLPTALTVLIIILLLQTDSVRAGKTFSEPSALRSWLNSWTRREFWLGENSRKEQQVILVLFLVSLPYWHGSIFLAALIFLFCLAMISTNRLYLLGAASGGILYALLQQKMFGTTPLIDANIFQPGFISEDKSFSGLLIYLLKLTGILLPLMLIVFIVLKKLRFWIAISALPLVFSFLFSLTPDVTVNHKLIMITFILWSIPLAYFLLGIPQATSKFAAKLLLRPVVILLTLLLTITGLYECLIFHNLSKIYLTIPVHSELTEWIETKTAPDAIFLTAPFAYNQFFLTGRRAWYGHPYYAWSAGHDTETRFRQLLTLTQRGTAKEIQDYVEENAIDAILIDDEARAHPELPLDEKLIASIYPMIASFPRQNNSRIYLLNRDLLQNTPLHR